MEEFWYSAESARAPGPPRTVVQVSARAISERAPLPRVPQPALSPSGGAAYPEPGRGAAGESSN